MLLGAGAMVAVAYCQQAVALALLHAADRRVCAAAVTAAAAGTARKRARRDGRAAARPPHPLGSVGTVREMVAAALARTTACCARARWRDAPRGRASLADLRAATCARLGTTAALDALAHAHAAEAKARDAGKPRRRRAVRRRAAHGGRARRRSSRRRTRRAARCSRRATRSASRCTRGRAGARARGDRRRRSLVAATTLAAVPLTAERRDVNVAPAPSRATSTATLEARARAGAAHQAALAAARSAR